MAIERVGIGPGPYTAKLEQVDNTRTGADSILEMFGSYSECITAKNYMMGLGASEITGPDSKGDGNWTVRGFFAFGFNGQVSDFSNVPSMHELDTNVCQTSIYRSSKLRTGLSPSELGIVAKVVQDYQAGLYPTADQQNEIPPITSAFDGAVDDLQEQIDEGNDHVAGVTCVKAQHNATFLFEAVALLGVEDFIEYYSVYRRTLTAATPSQVKASREGVGKIWTTAEVAAWENIDPSGWFTLDPGAMWLKSRPTVQGVADQKTLVVYSYTECITALGLVYDAYKTASLLYPLET